MKTGKSEVHLSIYPPKRSRVTRLAGFNGATAVYITATFSSYSVHLSDLMLMKGDLLCIHYVDVFCIFD